jgi:hypothetical protein
MRPIPTLLLPIILLLTVTASAQRMPEQVQRDTTVLRYRRLGVRMIRTWQVKDTTQRVPDPCDIWDTTLIIPLKDGGLRKRRMRIEHEYSRQGLRTATRIYRTEDGRTWLWRRFRYLYTFAKR